MNEKTIREKRKELDDEEQKANEIVVSAEKSQKEALVAIEKKRDALILQCERAGNHGSKTLIGGCRLCGWTGSPA